MFRVELENKHACWPRLGKIARILSAFWPATKWLSSFRRTILNGRDVGAFAAFMSIDEMLT